MGEQRKNANERRLEHLRALRDDVLDGPSTDAVIAEQAERIAELEAEVARLRSLLDALRPRPERSGSSTTTGRSRPSASPLS